MRDGNPRASFARPPRLRLNPAVDVVPWPALSSDEQQHVQRLLGAGPVAAIARPRTPAATTVKAVDAATLALLERFREAASFPGGETADSLPAFVERFVLDGILEIEIGGRFVGGPAAIDVFGEDERPPAPSNRAAVLSLEALRYAQSLPTTDARTLSARLYMFNAVPFGPAWESAFGSAGRIGELLGVGAMGANRATLDAAGYDAVDHAQWYAWSRGCVIVGGALPELPFKLYVSPHPACLADVFSRALPVLVRHKVGSLKVGRTAQNLLRADKFVAYVESEHALIELAAALEPLLRGFRAQGVPFTCGLDAEGMLSWGSDPPRALSFDGWSQAESWRACIADYLALGLLQARAASHPEPWRFALRKAAAAGVDTARWAPRSESARGGVAGN